jgi:hypothetical protein
MNVALFISGRILGYDKCLIPMVNNFKLASSADFKVKVFFSINTFSLAKDENILDIIKHLKELLGDKFGDIYYEDYKLPYDWVQSKLQNGTNSFIYNQMSCFYNDKQNLRLIEEYQIMNNMNFDIISKIRSDITSSPIYLKWDNPNELVLRTSLTGISFWGHLEQFSKLPYQMISDAFAYGNMKSMRIYCKTYDWTLEQNRLRKGHYHPTFEMLLTQSVINYRINDHDDGNNNPNITSEQLLNIFLNNKNNIKIIYEKDINYNLLPIQYRNKNNFVVDKTNVLTYTHSCPE